MEPGAIDFNALRQRRDAAARRIQAAWRAYRGRKAFLRLRDAASRIQAVAKGWYVRKQVQQHRDRQELEKRFHAIMDKRREKIRVLEMEKRELLAMPGKDMEEWEQRRVMAAIKVQAHWRGLVARRKMTQSPERARREQAARRIQAAFKKVLQSRRGTGALSAAFASAAGLRARDGSPLRQSGASVLLGSPQLRGSPAGASSVGPSPQRPATAGAVGPGAGAADGGGLTRNISMMGPKRYKELKTQVEGKLTAYVTMAKSRGSRRPDPRVADARLAELLREYHRTAPDRIAAVHGRQRDLVVMDTLCVQLEQMTPLADLPPDAAPQDFPRQARGSERAERAAQAHALMLAEAKVGSRWWTHLRGLNMPAVQASLLAEDEERWAELESRWRRRWTELEDQENRRPDPVEELKCQTGTGAAAVLAAREAAAMAAKDYEYKTRMAKAAVAVPAGPALGGGGAGGGAGGQGGGAGGRSGRADTSGD